MKTKIFKAKSLYGIVVLFFLLNCLTSCKDQKSSSQNGDNQQAQELYVDAMKIHDEAMQKMEEAKQLKRQLNKFKDSVSADVKGDHADQFSKIDSIVNLLGQADEEMMAWMENVKTVPNQEGDKSAYSGEMTKTAVSDTTDLVKIQRDQKQKIQDINERMDSSVDEARNILNLPKIKS